MNQTQQTIVDDLKQRAEASGMFGEITATATRLQCAAAAAAEPAWYRVDRTDEGWEVSLVTADRWLSESIEADLMHDGDPIEELIEEELVELGYTGEAITVKHFRSDDMLYTFCNPIPVTGQDDETDTGVILQYLLAYEAAFRELGDMQPDEDEL